MRRARRTADKAGVELTLWEGDFLDDVSARVAQHGRAFADPDKGAPGQALSALQGRKLREIVRKARGEPIAPRKPFRRGKPAAADDQGA